MLLQMNSGLEDDRRSLMDHVSLLLSQYHELLTHSLEDKEHYHMEEKIFTLVTTLYCCSRKLSMGEFSRYDLVTVLTSIHLARVKECTFGWSPVYCK